MNTKTKRRLVVVSGIIILLLIVTLALVGGNSTAKALSIAEVLDGDYQDQKIQVSGNVVDNSFETNEGVLTFAIYDPEGDPSKQLKVSYEGGVSSSFGNDVVAICTGKMGEDQILYISELVTKCPSKYENATDALGVEQLLNYGDEVSGKPVKVVGTVAKDSLTAAGQGDRFVLIDEESSDELPVEFDGALPDDVTEGSRVVLTGSLTSQLKFAATDVALEG